MAIIGVTDRHRESDFPGGLSIIGKIWRGEPKPEKGYGIGKDLCDRFRVEIDDPYWRKKFLDAYGTLTPTRLNILLPFETVERVFETWYTAFSSQGFKHKCNGERIVEAMVGESYELRGDQKIHYAKKQVNLPCKRGNSPACADCGDKGSGLFTFYIKELFSAGAGSTKGFRMSIGGRNDIPEFTRQLATLEATYGSLSGSPFPYPDTFGFIPYTLSRVKTATTKPIVEAKTVNGKKQYSHTGGRTQSEYWALQISEDADWLGMLQKFQREKEIRRISEIPALAQLYGYEPIAAIPATKPIALPQSSIEVQSVPSLPAAIEVDQSLVNRLTAIRSFTKHTDEAISQICSEAGVSARQAAQDFSAFLALFRALLIDWGNQSSPIDCSETFNSLMINFEEDPSESAIEADRRFMIEWQNTIEAVKNA